MSKLTKKSWWIFLVFLHICSCFLVPTNKTKCPETSDEEQELGRESVHLLMEIFRRKKGSLCHTMKRGIDSLLMVQFGPVFCGVHQSVWVLESSRVLNGLGSKQSVPVPSCVKICMICYDCGVFALCLSMCSIRPNYKHLCSYMRPERFHAR